MRVEMQAIVRSIPAFLLMLFGAPVGLAAEEPRREAVHRMAELRGREKEPEWKQAFEHVFEKKISFEFVETPVDEAVSFLQTLLKVGMILDPQALEGRKPPVETLNLKVRDMKMRHALEWILRFACLDYALRDGAIFISTPEELEEERVLRTYDVRDLISRDQDYPAPEMDLAGRPLPARSVADKPQDLPGASSVAELIGTRVRRSNWMPEPGTSIVDRAGTLIAQHRRSVHANLATYLRRCGAESGVQVAVEARLLVVASKLLKKVRDIRKTRSQTVFLREARLEFIAEALEAGEARQLDVISLTCLNGQRAHALSGRTFRPEGEAEARFRGTILEVRPLLSFDRAYVTTDIQLTRIEGGETPHVFKLSTAFACLDADTVLLAGGALENGDSARRLIVLVTPRVLRREPEPEPRGFYWVGSRNWK